MVGVEAGIFLRLFRRTLIFFLCPPELILQDGVPLPKLFHLPGKGGLIPGGGLQSLQLLPQLSVLLLRCRQGCRKLFLPGLRFPEVGFPRSQGALQLLLLLRRRFRGAAQVAELLLQPVPFFLDGFAPLGHALDIGGNILPVETVQRGTESAFTHALFLLPRRSSGVSFVLFLIIAKPP